MEHEQKIATKNLDIMKLVLSVLVVILHLQPFVNRYQLLHYAIGTGIGRICVPLFFITSGYFIEIKSKNDPDYIRKYLKQNMKTYFIWSMLYIPVLIFDVFMDPSLIDQYVHIQPAFEIFGIFKYPLLITASFLVLFLNFGVYYHLWFFPALMLAVVLLYWLKKKLSIQSIILISFGFLVLGSIETYWGIVPLYVQDAVSLYFKYFITTRNGLFFGLFYVSLGSMIASQFQNKVIHHIPAKLVASIMLFIADVTFLHSVERLDSNIIISIIPLSFYLFMYVTRCLPSYEGNNTKKIRAISKYLYLIHPMIFVAIGLLNITNVHYVLLSLVGTMLGSFLLAQWSLTRSKM